MKKRILDLFLILVAVLAWLLFLDVFVHSAEPQFTVVNKTAPAFTVVNRIPVETLLIGGVPHVKGSDGVYRPTTTDAAPAVAAPRTFRDPHACPACGRLQFVVSGWNRNGTHSHTCPRDGTTWSH